MKLTANQLRAVKAVVSDSTDIAITDEQADIIAVMSTISAEDRKRIVQLCGLMPAQEDES